MRKLLADHKDWTRMTPDEMFGVASADKPDKSDTAGQPDGEASLEHFFEQENQPGSALKTNGQNARANSPWDFPRDRNDAGSFNSQRSGAENLEQNSGRLPSHWWNNDASANQNGNTTWDSFSTPVQQTPAAPDLGQQAAMDRFRQLLAPNPAPATEASQNSKLFSAPNAQVDPNFTQPEFAPNPSGASFTPLSSGIGLPAGLTPLPGIVTPISQPVATPSWAPQPAPWLSSTPQPFAIPQRKF
jgi:hypothetical protein